MLPREGRDLRNLGFGDLEREHAANTFAFGMDLQHNARGGRPIHTEDSFQDVDDELHRRVVVVQQD